MTEEEGIRGVMRRNEDIIEHKMRYSEENYLCVRRGLKIRSGR